MMKKEISGRLGADEPAQSFIRRFMLYNLGTFLLGCTRSRAWTFVKGMKAPQAAGAIHTD